MVDADKSDVHTQTRTHHRDTHTHTHSVTHTHTHTQSNDRVSDAPTQSCCLFATIVACDTRAQLERTVNVHARGETNKLMKSDCVAAAHHKTPTFLH